jgi:4-nitrophenyl phosphatase
MNPLTRIQGLIIDGDGVLWLDDTPLPGLDAFFQTLRARRLPFVIATNNATTSPDNVRRKLASFGVEVGLHEILTSSEATAGFLRSRLSPGARVLAIGEAGLRSALQDAGFQVTEQAQDVKAVVAALDRSVTYARLSEAALAIQAGALFVGTNPDPSFPTPRGLTPGSGAILAALTATTGCQPLVIGKPEPHLFRQALDRLGTEASLTLGVGDRLETDILGGRRAGLTTALVLTGITRREDLPDADVQPDWVFADLLELRDALAGGGV